MNAPPTRPVFLAALRTLDEGAQLHSPHELADAKDAVKTVARYQWGQIALFGALVICLTTLGEHMHLKWPWHAELFACAIVSAFAYHAIMLIPPIRPIFVPAGFEPDDVIRAARYVFA